MPIRYREKLIIFHGAKERVMSEERRDVKLAVNERCRLVGHWAWLVLSQFCGFIHSPAQSEYVQHRHNDGNSKIVDHN